MLARPIHRPISVLCSAHSRSVANSRWSALVPWLALKQKAYLMSRRLFYAQLRPPLPVNGHRVSGRSFLMVTTINSPDTGLRIFLEQENVPEYLRGRTRLQRLSRFELSSSIKVNCQLPPRATSYYLLPIDRLNLSILVEPRSRSFFLLDSNQQLTSLDRDINKKLDLPER